MLRTLYGQKTTGTRRYLRDTWVLPHRLFSRIPKTRDPDVDWFNIRGNGVVAIYAARWVNRPWRADVGHWASLAFIGCVLGFELLVSPIVGLSDNGDFAREIGYFDYGPVQRDPPVRWAYVAPTYSWQKGVRKRDYEQVTSDFLFVAPAVWISKLTPSRTLPITLVGALHLAGLLAAVGRLFSVTRRLSGRAVLWITSALVLTDVGYAAYANSFFAEASAGVFAIWVIAEAIAACAQRQSMWLFCTASFLLVLAKPQTAPLALPLAIFCSCITWRQAAMARLALSVGILAAGFAVLAAVKEQPKLETSYNMLFAAILPESRDPRRDLRALHLDPELVRYKGTRAWSPGAGLYEKELQVTLRQDGPVQLAGFYALRPARLWRHVTTLFPLATQIRPEACGNFTMSAEHPAGARTTRFSIWSNVHQYLFGRVTKFLLFGLAAMLAAGIVLWNRLQFAPAMALLPSLALLSFFTAAFGDANEPIKHQYLFNLLLDACLVFALLGVSSRIGRVRIAQTNSSTPPTAIPTIRNGSSSSQTTG